MKTITELSKEAQELGVDVHDHVAEVLWGTVNMITRHSAKQYTFCELYGGTGRVSKEGPSIQSVPPNVQNSKRPWTMTKEQIEAQTPREFKQEWMNEPFKQYDDCPAMDIPPPEDRMHRVGVVPYKVKVFNDTGWDTYTVHATSALDARCMAFVLDGGCEAGPKHWDDGHIELAITYTEIVG
jgi:hypothetical protein